MASMTRQIEVWQSSDTETRAALELVQLYDRAKSMESWEVTPTEDEQDAAWGDVEAAYERWLALR